VNAEIGINIAHMLSHASIAYIIEKLTIATGAIFSLPISLLVL